MKLLLEATLLLTWFGLWGLGGIWLVRGAFILRSNEQGLVGLAVGWVIQNLLTNMLVHIMPLFTSSWVSAGIVFAGGLLFSITSGGWRSLYRIPIRPGQWLLLAALAAVMIQIERGLAIFDDYAHLPTVSMMAAGDVPPHFPLDPSVSYGYHYFLLLWSAQLVRIASLFPWTALDVARGLSIALTIMLSATWVQRITRSSLAGLLGGMMTAFGTGTRWLLLLLPASWLKALSGQVNMLGSGLQSGPELSTALTGNWVIEGGGPLAYPFAFVNGILSPGVMAHGSNGMISGAASFPILLTFNHWRDWKGGLITALLLSSTYLMTEKGIILSLAGWGTITLLWMIYNRSWRLPRSLWKWWLVLLGGFALGIMQGGALSGILSDFVDESAAVSYQTVNFKLVFAPQLVSAHLGVLSLLKPLQLLAALAEIGPVILMAPLVVIYAWRAFKVGRWYEAVGIFAGVISIVTVFVEFTGSTGVRNTSRLYSFIGTFKLWAVPLVWIWAARRKEWVKTTAVALFVVTILGGVVLFGTELPAAQRPVRTYLVNDQDALMERDFWNRLEPGALVFDSHPNRSPLLFGRGTNSSTTWYATKPEWSKLAAAPDVSALRAAGYSYVYLDTRYWDGLTPLYQQSFQSECVKVLQEYEDYKHDFRRLLDIRACP